MSIITISRQAGSLGDEVAEALSHKLGWELITHDKIISEFLSKIASPHELRMLTDSAKFYLNQRAGGGTFLEYLKQALLDYSREHSAILVGFGSQSIFAGSPDALHIRIVSPQDIRVSRIKKQYHVSDSEAAEILATSDRKHRRFVSVLFDVDLEDNYHYDLILNTADISIYECLPVIISLFRDRELRKQQDIKAENMNVISNMDDLPMLKNPSEIEFAKILDMYQIDWKYEPKTFPIEWDAEGNVTLAFSPDFYLTKFDTYIELTTMNQKYISKKIRKINKLRELYPGTNIRIVNKKNFSLLIERFNMVKGD